MKIFKAAVIGIGLLGLGGCAVYEPYPAYGTYPSYPAYPPAVVVQPQIYGSWGYWSGGPRYGGHYGHRHHGRGWGHGGRHWR
jgi:hypothetical protein